MRERSSSGIDLSAYRLDRPQLSVPPTPPFFATVCCSAKMGTVFHTGHRCADNEVKQVAPLNCWEHGRWWRQKGIACPGGS
eukprot:scaffold250987_cov32-Tisochrysis_lutea.AAC.5